MGIIILMFFLFGAVAFFSVYSGYDKKNKNPDKKIKWVAGLIFATTGMFVGSIFSSAVGEKIAKKYLANQKTSVIVLETVNLLPLNDNGVYVVIYKNEKKAWYLRENSEALYADIIGDKYMIVFSNATAVKQLVKVNAGSFWGWFAVIPKYHRFVIPFGGLQKYG